MSTYKVIQDIEAEDKLLGPLTLRQFIFAIIAVFCYYICYLLISKHVGVLSVLFLPPALFASFFAIPFGGDQPTEIWALAKIRFWFKPRRRIWDQDGAKELVTVTAPKKVEEVRTNGLSQTEVQSRLSALASTIDSRGWAVKNVNLNLYAQPSQTVVESNSDRLVGLDGLPQEVPTTDIQAADDILDAQNNPIAHQFDEMIAASTQAHRKQIMDMMNRAGDAAVPSPALQAAKQATITPAAPQADYWFLNQPVEPPKLSRDQAMFAAPTVVSNDQGLVSQPTMVQAAEPTADEQALVERLKAARSQPTIAYSHLKTIQPLGMPEHMVPVASPPAQNDLQSAAQKTVAEPVTPKPNPAIIQLANNNDLNVATIARQAREAQPELPDEGEVVIALH